MHELNSLLFFNTRYCAELNKARLDSLEKKKRKRINAPRGHGEENTRDGHLLGVEEQAQTVLRLVKGCQNLQINSSYEISN